MSKMEKIIAKLQDSGSFSAEDLIEIQETVKEMVDEKVEILVEEKTTELETLAEEYCAKQIDEGVVAEKEKLEAEYETKYVELEDRLVENIDQFLDVQICENISDEALKSVAINETYAPIIEGIKTLFEDKYTALDVEGDGLLKDYKEKLDESEEKVSSLIAEKIELSNLAEASACKLLISEKVKDLTDTDRERVLTFFEGKDFDEIESKIDGFVDMVIEKETIVTESKVAKVTSKETISESEVTSESECIEEEVIDMRDKVEDEKSETEITLDQANFFM